MSGIWIQGTEWWSALKLLNLVYCTMNEKVIGEYFKGNSD